MTGKLYSSNMLMTWGGIIFLMTPIVHMQDPAFRAGTDADLQAEKVVAETDADTVQTDADGVQADSDAVQADSDAVQADTKVVQPETKTMNADPGRGIEAVLVPTVRNGEDARECKDADDTLIIVSMQGRGKKALGRANAKKFKRSVVEDWQAFTCSEYQCIFTVNVSEACSPKGASKPKSFTYETFNVKNVTANFDGHDIAGNFRSTAVTIKDVGDFEVNEIHYDVTGRILDKMEVVFDLNDSKDFYAKVVGLMCCDEDPCTVGQPRKVLTAKQARGVSQPVKRQVDATDDLLQKLDCTGDVCHFEANLTGLCVRSRIASPTAFNFTLNNVASLVAYHQNGNQIRSRQLTGDVPLLRDNYYNLGDSLAINFTIKDPNQFNVYLNGEVCCEPEQKI